MKKKLLSLGIIICIMLSMTVMPVSAASSGSCGAKVTWTLDGGTLTISGTGDMTDYKSSPTVPWNSLKSQIKAFVVQDGVTKIGNFAISGFSGITSVTLPNSVTKIGDNAFSNLTNITSLTIPDSVTIIGSRAFEGCTGLTSITIPNSVALLGDWAFSNCTGIKQVTISDSIKSIPQRAFSDCTSLASVIIPDGITDIGSEAFSGCLALNSVTFTCSVTSIGKNAFNNCDNLTDVFYVGSDGDWNKISIGENNNCFKKSKVSYIDSSQIGNKTISVILNGKKVRFDQPPIIKDGRTLVPLRAIFEALTATVDWDDTTKTVTSKKGETVISMTIGKNVFYKNGSAVALDVPAQIVNERTLVPVRAIAESFDCSVGWDAETQVVTLKE